MSTQEQIRAIAPENKVAVGSSLQTAAQIMAGYADAGDKGVVGGYSGTFPLTAASQGGIYLVPQTGKFYVCETAYNGTQLSAPNSNFVELSVWKNHDRLNNLLNPEIIYQDETTTIKRLYKHIGLLAISGRVKFHSGTLIGNMYKYYSSDFTFEKSFNIDEISKYIMLYQAIPLYGINQNNHFFCILGVNGIMQMVGDGEWTIASTQLVFLR